MAGESPDKSDKKQSSGEAAQSGRDPRLSVLRGKPDEPAKETGAAEAAENSETPEKGEAPEGSDAPQEATADAEGGDGRLRDAVAAWVAGKGDEGDAEESADGAGDDGEAGESGSGSPASAGRASEGSGSEGSDESGSKASVSEGGSEKAGSEKGGSEEAGSEGSSGAVKGDSEGAVAKPAAKSDAKAGVKSDAKGGKSGAKGGVKGEAKTAAKAAEAEAPVDATDEAEAKTDAKAKDKDKSKAKVEPEGKADSGAKPGAKAEREVVDQPTAVFKTVGAQKGASGSEGDGKADDAAGEPGDGEAGDGGSAVDEATRVFAIAKGKGKAASGEAVDQATTAFKINPPAKGRSAEQSKDTKDASAEQANGKAAEGTKGSPGSKDSDKGKDESASKDEAKDKSKDKSKAKDEAEGSKGASGAKGGGSAAESDAERTSQFVALKSADDSTAGRSLGKTAPRTPARTPGKDVSKETAKETPKGATKDATKYATKDAPKETSKGADKPAGKAPGASAGSLPAAAPAKPGTSPKPADRAGAMPPAADAGAAADPAGLPESERTKQQPLPPLDLLAKLTNTPPPPETPLRIVVRRFKIWTPLAVLLAIIFVVAQSLRPLPDPTLTVGDATSSFTFEGGKLTIPWPAQGQAAIKVVGSGDLGTFGPQKPVPTASVAKIMTAYVTLRDHPLKKDEGGPQIEVDAKAVTEGGSRHESRIEGLKAGQKFSQQNMLKMLMIPSGNNIARLLARWDTKSDNEAAFVKKMNAAAKDLGMKNTTYTDPSGLDPKTVSTAVDQLKLAEAVMKYDAFRPIVAMTNADIPGLSQRINSNIDNLLLAGLSIKGIKTGSSTAAGGTLSWAAYKTVDGKDRLILGTMMDQHFKGLDPDGANSLTLVKDNSQKVIEAVRNALTSAPAVKKGQVVGYVDDGLNGLTPVVATKDLKAVGVPGQKLKLSVGDGGKTVPHTAKAGTEVGVLTVGNGESMQKVPVALKEDLVEPSFGAKLVRIT
ncbi:D-alanyl-D-alanine carboxypeptidase [Streptomyces lydicus]|uniref:D-alanyl-D-alanine carboxypeptidase n=1 Tax=Streptomyces lydicus TaxID=47763 RepID=UPI002E37AECB|nr:D-alanyl-D-alanine carboxypeptidase [Streptomyces lydicus]